MMAELGFIISLCAIALSVITTAVCKNMTDEHREALKQMRSRVYYLEIALSYHDMVPLPWEMEEFDEKPIDRRSVKRSGNIVYLTQEGE